MNMLQIIHNATIGGAEVHTRLITKAFARKGHRITFVYGPGPYARYNATLAERGVECIEYDLKKNVWHSVLFLRKLIKERNIDIIHSHMHGADFLALCARIGLNVRHMTTIHCLPQQASDLLYRYKSSLATFVSYHFMHKIFAVSAAAADQMRRDMRLPGKKIAVAFNSIDFDEMTTDATTTAELNATLKPFSDSRIIVCTGSLYWIKGQTYLIDAMQQLRGSYPHLRLVLIGRGEGENELREQVRRLNLDNTILFAGHQMNVPDWLGVADIYCQPSLVDAMPRALLEAMYMELPVIVSDIENLRQAVTHQHSGIVVPVRSSHALADAIRDLLETPEAAKRLGAAARAFVVKNCSMDTMAEKIIAEIERTA